MKKIGLIQRYLAVVLWVVGSGFSCTSGTSAHIDSPSTSPCQQPLASPLSFAAIQSTIDACGITKLEELIPRLPEVYRSRYLLVHDSRSLQGATPENPRVISYGADASFVLAFNGQPGLPGYDVLETTTFDRQAARFIYREIQFPADSKNSASSKKPIAGPENPALCLRCHQADPRPNWDDYFLWPGTFGAEDDSFFALDHNKPAASAFPEERALFARFNPVRGRYAALSVFSDPSPTPSGFPDQLTDFANVARRNLNFTMLIGRLNGERIARMISEIPGITPYRYLLLAAASCRPPVSDDGVMAPFQDWSDLTTYLPAKMRASYPLTQDQELAIVRQGGRASFENRVQRHFQITGLKVAEDPRIESMHSHPGQGPIDPVHKDYGDSPEAYDSSMGNILWAFQALGAGIDGWSTEFARDGNVAYAFHMLASEVGGAERPLWQRLLDPVADADLEALFAPALQSGLPYNEVDFDESQLPEVCGLLRTKSLAALAL